jgi:CubicO group peptidase (beta-lactamase class C family)|tara:strand:- start:64 stop:762 length:699 start_codon:yes stop_codon:yes gene_type:complete
MKVKILLLFILIFSSTYSQSTNSLIKNYLDSINASEFSGAVLIAQNDRIIEKRAYGLSSIEYDVKNKIDTKFNIASITKMFTAVAALQLYEQGKIALKTPIGEYLPEYPNETVRNNVTVHQLLTHTSGLNNFYVSDLDKIRHLEYEEISDFVPLFVNDTLLSKPGTKYDYSGTGFVVLGLIIEKVSGENYYDYIRKHILEPSEMMSTSEIAIDSVVKIKQADILHNLVKMNF